MFFLSTWFYFTDIRSRGRDQIPFSLAVRKLTPNFVFPRSRDTVPMRCTFTLTIGLFYPRPKICFLTLERGRGREKEKHQLPPIHAAAGDLTPIWVCALTGNQTHNLSGSGTRSNQLSTRLSRDNFMLSSLSLFSYAIYFLVYLILTHLELCHILCFLTGQPTAFSERGLEYDACILFPEETLVS